MAPHRIPNKVASPNDSVHRPGRFVSAWSSYICTRRDLVSSLRMTVTTSASDRCASSDAGSPSLERGPWKGVNTDVLEGCGDHWLLGSAKGVMLSLCCPGRCLRVKCPPQKTCLGRDGRRSGVRREQQHKLEVFLSPMAHMSSWEFRGVSRGPKEALQGRREKQSSLQPTWTHEGNALAKRSHLCGICTPP